MSHGRPTLTALAIATACAASALLAPAASAHHRHRVARRGPRTFYVAPNGSDSNPGTSPARPWRTVWRVDWAWLQPGDVVRFQGGARFSDTTLMPGQGFLASGTRGHPIVFTSYGRGQATLTQ